MANQRSTLFYKKSEQHLEDADLILGLQSKSFLAPYSNASYHVLALLHPLNHLAKALYSATRIVYGCYLFLDSFLDKPVSSIPKALNGIVNESVAVVIHIINALVSILALITRSVASLINSGPKQDTAADSELDSTARELSLYIK